jgi:hypothetical protein
MDAAKGSAGKTDIITGKARQCIAQRPEIPIPNRSQNDAESTDNFKLVEFDLLI